MKKLLSVFILFFSISLFCFYSERYLEQDKYYYYLFINDSVKNLDVYPVFKDDYENKKIFDPFSEYLVSKNLLTENGFIKNFSFIIDPYLVYSEQSKVDIYIKGKYEKKINQNLFISTSAFILTDTSNPEGVKVKAFKDFLIAGFEEGYITYRNEKVFLTFGRTYFNSGFDYQNSLIFSYNAPPMDGITFFLKLNDKLNFISKFSNLGEMILDSTYNFDGDDIERISRFLSFHRLIFFYRDLSLSFSESVIFGRNTIANIFDYTFPFFIFYGEQNNIDKNDNILWELSLNYKLFKKLNISYSFLIDDYQYEYEGIKDLEPPELGHLLNLTYPFSKGFLKITYARVNAWVYNQRFPWNRYIYNGRVIGYKDGPDMQSIKVFVDYVPVKNLKTNVSVEYNIKGNNYVETPWVFPSTNIYWYKTQIGVEPLSRWLNLTFGLEYIFNKFIFYSSVSYNHQIENFSKFFELKSGIKIVL
ncbi:MAG: hypothetical protein ABIN05_00045 [candidate division WOR-3 bacterium]